MLVSHSSGSHHPHFFITPNGSYDIQTIQESLSERQKWYLLFCNSFTICDTVFAIAGHEKTTLFDSVNHITTIIPLPQMIVVIIIIFMVKIFINQNNNRMSVSNFTWHNAGAFSGFVKGTWMSTWTSFLIQKPSRR